MNISFTFKNFEPSDHLKKYAARRFEKLARFVPKSDNVEISIGMAVDKFRHKIDVQFSGDNLNISAFEESQDMYASVDMVLDKLESQVKKHFSKLKDKRHGHGSRKPVIDVFNYSRTAKKNAGKNSDSDFIEPETLSANEAALQLEDSEDEFLVFINSETEAVNIIYRRSNGNYGLIVPGV